MRDVVSRAKIREIEGNPSFWPGKSKWFCRPAEKGPLGRIMSKMLSIRPQKNKEQRTEPSHKNCMKMGPANSAASSTDSYVRGLSAGWDTPGIQVLVLFICLAFTPKIILLQSSLRLRFAAPVECQ